MNPFQLHSHKNDITIYIHRDKKYTLKKYPSTGIYKIVSIIFLYKTID